MTLNNGDKNQMIHATVHAGYHQSKLTNFSQHALRH